MSIEFLQFGNVTVAALILTLTVLIVSGGLQLLMYIGRFTLSLDSEGAPKMLTENWLWGKVDKLLVVRGNGGGDKNWCVMVGSETYDRGDKCLWRSTFCTSWFSKKEEADLIAKDIGGRVVGEGEKRPYLNTHLVGKSVAALLLTDLAILWLQTHFMSAIWCLSTAGIVLTIRYLSSKVWNHNNRITVLEGK